MTNIEIVNAINSAIADGRMVKANDVTVTGAFLRQGLFGEQYVLMTWDTDPYPQEVKVTTLRKDMQIRSFIQHKPVEDDVHLIRGAIPCDSVLSQM
jgi:hypothetical protein